jgi:hypothetical protein
MNSAASGRSSAPSRARQDGEDMFGGVSSFLGIPQRLDLLAKVQNSSIVSVSWFCRPLALPGPRPAAGRNSAHRGRRHWRDRAGPLLGPAAGPAHGVPVSAIVILAATLNAVPSIPAIGLVLYFRSTGLSGSCARWQLDRQLRGHSHCGRLRIRSSTCRLPRLCSIAMSLWRRGPLKRAACARSGRQAKTRLGCSPYPSRPACRVAR